MYDPNTIIFEEEQSTNNSKNNKNENFGIKVIEIVESGINDIIQDNGKVPKLPDTSSIFKKVLQMKEDKHEVNHAEALVDKLKRDYEIEKLNIRFTGDFLSTVATGAGLDDD